MLSSFFPKSSSTTPQKPAPEKKKEKTTPIHLQQPQNEAELVSFLKKIRDIFPKKIKDISPSKPVTQEKALKFVRDETSISFYGLLCDFVLKSIQKYNDSDVDDFLKTKLCKKYEEFSSFSAFSKREVCPPNFFNSGKNPLDKLDKTFDASLNKSSKSITSPAYDTLVGEFNTHISGPLLLSECLDIRENCIRIKKRIDENRFVVSPSNKEKFIDDLNEIITHIENNILNDRNYFPPREVIEYDENRRLIKSP